MRIPRSAAFADNFLNIFFSTLFAEFRQFKLKMTSVESNQRKLLCLGQIFNKSRIGITNRLQNVRILISGPFRINNVSENVPHRTYRRVYSSPLLAFPSTSRFYGCGFFIANEWIDKIHRVWKVSDRICVLQLNIENTPRSAEEYKKSKSEFRPTLYTIINVYAPTTERRQK